MRARTPSEGDRTRHEDHDHPAPASHVDALPPHSRGAQASRGAHPMEHSRVTAFAPRVARLRTASIISGLADGQRALDDLNSGRAIIRPQDTVGHPDVSRGAGRVRQGSGAKPPVVGRRFPMIATSARSGAGSGWQPESDQRHQHGDFAAPPGGMTHSKLSTRDGLGGDTRIEPPSAARGKEVGPGAETVTAHAPDPKPTTRSGPHRPAESPTPTVPPRHTAIMMCRGARTASVRRCDDRREPRTRPKRGSGKTERGSE